MSAQLFDGFENDEAMARLAVTRLSWHQAAEWLVAGPQHRAEATIRLQVVPGGFATRDGDVRVEGSELVLPDGRRVPLKGTLGDVAAAAGITGGIPDGVYSDSSAPSADTLLAVDPEAANALAQWFELGAAALTALAPDEAPVLWPEHFDVGITMKEVNYGISLGDANIAAPYAYVGPWKVPAGEFWDQPFGAARTWDKLADVSSIVAFFESGRAAAEV